MSAAIRFREAQLKELPLGYLKWPTQMMTSSWSVPAQTTSHNTMCPPSYAGLVRWLMTFRKSDPMHTWLSRPSHADTMTQTLVIYTVWCPNSAKCPNFVTQKQLSNDVIFQADDTEETSAIILENIYFIMITNGSYKGHYYIMKNAVKSSVCEIEPFRWLIHQWLT